MSSQALSQVQILSNGKETEANHCGYCDTNNSISYGLWGISLTNADYQALIDRGWRRSGKYLYKPEMKKTCCPAYTIRLPCDKFAISKSQKKSRRKVEKYLEGSLSQKEMMEEDEPEESTQKKSSAAEDVKKALEEKKKVPEEKKVSEEKKAPEEKKKQEEKKPAASTSTLDSTSTSSTNSASSASTSKASGFIAKLKGKDKKEKETKQAAAPAAATAPAAAPVAAAAGGEPTVTFEMTVPGGKSLTITTQRSVFTKESYEVFKKYQKAIHNDDSTESGYQRFLVESPLIFEPGTEANPLGYGSFHQHYRIDGRLIAVGVIDILPVCVSSVYLYYDPEFSFLSMGVYSALSEINFVNKLRATVPQLKYYYLGFYIHSCAKMRYKAQYRPSDLLDPVSYTWHPLEACTPLLDQSKYSRFERESNGEVKAEGAAPAVNVDRVPVNLRGRVVLMQSLSGGPEFRDLMVEYSRRVGPELTARMVVLVR